MKLVSGLSTSLSTAYAFIRKTVTNLLEDGGHRLAAEASFYLIFSVFPLLFLVFSTIGYLDMAIPTKQTGAEFFTVISAHVPEFTQDTFARNLEGMLQQYNGGDVLMAALVFLWPASNVFHTYIGAVGTAYGIPDRRGYWKLRLVSVTLLFGSGIIMFLTALLFTGLPILLRLIGYNVFIDWPLAMVHLMRYVATFVLITPCVALIYRYGIDLRNQPSQAIWPGALFATVLWVLFSRLFGLYLTYLDTYRALYGTLGGAMLLLLWMYLVSLAIVLGAEFNDAWGDPDWREKDT